MSGIGGFWLHGAAFSRERRLQRHLIRLRRDHDVRQERLRRKMEKRCRRLRGDDRRFWSAQSGQIKACWRRDRQKLPESLRKQGGGWLRERLGARDYMALLRLYLVLLAARDRAFEFECNGLMDKRQ